MYVPRIILISLRVMSGIIIALVSIFCVLIVCSGLLSVALVNFFSICNRHNKPLQYFLEWRCYIMEELYNFIRMLSINELYFLPFFMTNCDPCCACVWRIASVCRSLLLWLELVVLRYMGRNYALTVDVFVHVSVGEAVHVLRLRGVRVSVASLSMEFVEVNIRVSGFLYFFLSPLEYCCLNLEKNHIFHFDWYVLSM